MAGLGIIFSLNALALLIVLFGIQHELKRIANALESSLPPQPAKKESGK